MRVALHLPSFTSSYAAIALQRNGSAVSAYPDPASLCAGLAGAAHDAVVTALRDANGQSASPLLRRLRTQSPMIPVVTYDVPSPGIAAAILRASRCGVAAVGLHGFDDLASLVPSVVADAHARQMADAVLLAAGDRLGPATRPIVAQCLAHAHAAPSVADVAAALTLSRKTVAARLAADGLPPASALVSWGRLLVAARYLEDDSRSVEHVAHALGFDSGTGLRHMLAHHTGLHTRDIRVAGGFAAVIGLFVEALAAGPGAPTRRTVCR